MQITPSLHVYSFNCKCSSPVISERSPKKTKRNIGKKYLCSLCMHSLASFLDLVSVVWALQFNISLHDFWRIFLYLSREEWRKHLLVICCLLWWSQCAVGHNDHNFFNEDKNIIAFHTERAWLGETVLSQHPLPCSNSTSMKLNKQCAINHLHEHYRTACLELADGEETEFAVLRAIARPPFRRIVLDEIFAAVQLCWSIKELSRKRTNERRTSMIWTSKKNKN